MQNRYWSDMSQSRWRMIAGLAATLAFSAYAEQPDRPDFYVVFQDCRTLGVGPSGGEVRSMQAPTYTLACWRRSRNVPCVFQSEGERKEITYTVDVDIPPMFTLVQGMHAGDYLSINANQHTAASITRILFENGGLATKLCSGVYVTADEFEAFKAGQAKGASPVPSSVQPARNSANRSSKPSQR